MNDIYDIKPALEMGRDWGWLVWAAAALVAPAAAVLAWRWWRRRKGTGVPPTPPVSPEAEAGAALDRLAAGEPTDGKQFYFDLSAILRRYVVRRWAVPAAEMTVEELLASLHRLTLEHDLDAQFRAFCQVCEPVKFAGAPPDRAQMAGDLAFVRAFVQRTTPAVPDPGLTGLTHRTE